MNPLHHVLDKLFKPGRLSRAAVLRDTKRQFRLYKTFPRRLCGRITGLVNFHEIPYRPGEVIAIGEIRQKIIRLKWDRLPAAQPINLAEDDALVWSVVFVDSQPYAVLETLSPYELWSRSVYEVLFYTGKEEREEVMALLRKLVPDRLAEAMTL